MGEYYPSLLRSTKPISIFVDGSPVGLGVVLTQEDPTKDKLFAVLGTPCVVKSDNGPPFNGEEFAKFAQTLGFKHRKVTSLWPKPMVKFNGS